MQRVRVPGLCRLREAAFRKRETGASTASTRKGARDRRQRHLPWPTGPLVLQEEAMSSTTPSAVQPLSCGQRVPYVPENKKWTPDNDMPGLRAPHLPALRLPAPSFGTATSQHGARQSGTSLVLQHKALPGGHARYSNGQESAETTGKEMREQ